MTKTKNNEHRMTANPTADRECSCLLMWSMVVVVVMQSEYHEIVVLDEESFPFIRVFYFVLLCLQ